MRRFFLHVLLPVLAVTLLLSETASAQWGFSTWWGGYRPTYSTYYTPSYSAYYAPTFYSAGYVPSTSYYVAPACSSCSPCSTGSCGLQTSCYIPSSFCSPCGSCSPCVSCGNNCFSNCSSGDCGLASLNNSAPTPVKPRAEEPGSQGRTPTFIEEEDRGPNSNYENKPKNDGTGDGFSPRKSDGSPDPLDQKFGTPNASSRDTLRFKILEPAPTHQPESPKTPTFRVNTDPESEYPLINLDEKITSRTVTQRTRLIQRRSWEQPVIAKNVTRQAPVGNLGWVPVPAPTQLVQK